MVGFNLSVKEYIRKRIYEFLHPTIESLINQFAIVENLRITQDEYEELL